MKPSQKIIIFLVSVLFVIYLIILYQKIATVNYQAPIPILPAESPSPTISLPAYGGHYSNTNFGFSFDYPSEYTLSENYPTPDHRSYYVSVMSPIDLTNHKGYELQDNELKIEIYIEPNDKNQTLDQIFNQAKSDAIKNTQELGGKVLYDKKTIEAGVPARTIAWEGVGSGTTTYFLKNNYLLTIIQYPAITSLQDTADTILRSLKFLDLSLITWDNKSIPIIRGEFTHYNSSDGCIYLVIDQPITTTKTLDQYVKEYTSTWSENFPKNDIQYTHPKFQILTLPAMNAEEISNIFIKKSNQIYKITAMVGIPEGPPRCKLNYDQEIGSLIKTLNF